MRKLELLINFIVIYSSKLIMQFNKKFTYNVNLKIKFMIIIIKILLISNIKMMWELKKEIFDKPNK